MFSLHPTPLSWVTTHAGPPDPITGSQVVILRPGSARGPTLVHIERGVNGRVLWRTVLATQSKDGWLFTSKRHRVVGNGRLGLW